MAQIKDEILIKKLAREIQHLRKDNNITQEVFYFDTNIHIARIEQGNKNISLSTLKAICKYFNIKMSDLLRKMDE